MEILDVSFTSLPIFVLILFRPYSVAQTTDNQTAPPQNSSVPFDTPDANGTDYDRNYERKPPTTTELQTTTECSSCLECYNCHLSIECAKTVGMTTEKCDSGIPCSSMERLYAGYLFMARGCADKARPPRCQNETIDQHRFLVCDCDTDLCNQGHCHYHFHNYCILVLFVCVWTLVVPGASNIFSVALGEY